MISCHVTAIAACDKCRLAILWHGEMCSQVSLESLLQGSQREREEHASKMAAPSCLLNAIYRMAVCDFQFHYDLSCTALPLSLQGPPVTSFSFMAAQWGELYGSIGLHTHWQAFVRVWGASCNTAGHKVPCIQGFTSKVLHIVNISVEEICLLQAGLMASLHWCITDGNGCSIRHLNGLIHSTFGGSLFQVY